MTGGGYVQDAKVFADRHPDLYEEVKNADITLPEAMRLSELREEDRDDVLARWRGGLTVREAIDEHFAARGIATPARFTKLGNHRDRTIAQVKDMLRQAVAKFESHDWDGDESEGRRGIDLTRRAEKLARDL